MSCEGAQTCLTCPPLTSDAADRWSYDESQYNAGSCCPIPGTTQLCHNDRLAQSLPTRSAIIANQSSDRWSSSWASEKFGADRDLRRQQRRLLAAAAADLAGAQLLRAKGALRCAAPRASSLRGAAGRGRLCNRRGPFQARATARHDQVAAAGTSLVIAIASLSYSSKRDRKERTPRSAQLPTHRVTAR